MISGLWGRREHLGLRGKHEELRFDSSCRRERGGRRNKRMVAGSVKRIRFTLRYRYSRVTSRVSPRRLYPLIDGPGE